MNFWKYIYNPTLSQNNPSYWKFNPLKSGKLKKQSYGGITFSKKYSILAKFCDFWLKGTKMIRMSLEIDLAQLIFQLATRVGNSVKIPHCHLQINKSVSENTNLSSWWSFVAGCLLDLLIQYRTCIRDTKVWVKPSYLKVCAE